MGGSIPNESGLWASPEAFIEHHTKNILTPHLTNPFCVEQYPHFVGKVYYRQYNDQFPVQEKNVLRRFTFPEETTHNLNNLEILLSHYFPLVATEVSCYQPITGPIPCVNYATHQKISHPEWVPRNSKISVISDVFSHLFFSVIFFRFFRFGERTAHNGANWEIRPNQPQQ
jgi:hypothetical protein